MNLKPTECTYIVDFTFQKFLFINKFNNIANSVRSTLAISVIAFIVVINKSWFISTPALNPTELLINRYVRIRNYVFT